MSDVGVPGETTVACSHCGAQNEASARFCDRCGRPLEGTSGGAATEVLELVEAVRAASVAGFEDEAPVEGRRALCPACGTPNDMSTLVGSGRAAQDATTNRAQLEVVAFRCGACDTPLHAVLDHTTDELSGAGGSTTGGAAAADEADSPSFDDPGRADRGDLYPHSRPVSHASFEDEVDRFEPSGPGTLRDRGDLLDEQGEDIRQYTGEPVETEHGWVVPVQQNFAGRDNIAGGGEWPDPHAPPAQPSPEGTRGDADEDAERDTEVVQPAAARGSRPGVEDQDRPGCGPGGSRLSGPGVRRRSPRRGRRPRPRAARVRCRPG